MLTLVFLPMQLFFVLFFLVLLFIPICGVPVVRRMELWTEKFGVLYESIAY